MTPKYREMAKFFCGFETFHALFHGYLLATNTTFIFLSFEISAPLNAVAAIVSATIATCLCLYAWFMHTGNRA